MKQIKFYKDNRGKWRWQATAENGKVIGASSQGFTRRSTAKQNAQLLLNALIASL